MAQPVQLDSQLENLLASEAILSLEAILARHHKRVITLDFPTLLKNLEGKESEIHQTEL